MNAKKTAPARKMPKTKSMSAVTLGQHSQVKREMRSARLQKNVKVDDKMDHVPKLATDEV